MNKDNFEDRIKNAFDQHRPEADTDAIWQNIEPQLKKKKKRRFIFFLLFGLGLLLLWRECGTWGLEIGKLNADVGNADWADHADLGVGKGKLEIGKLETGNADVGNADWADRADDADLGVGKGKLEIGKLETGNADVGNADLADRADDADLDEGREDLGKKDGSSAKDVEKNDSDKSKKDSHEKKKRKKANRRREPWAHNLGLQAGPALGLRFIGKNEKVAAPSGLLDGRRATENMMESWAGGLFYSAASRRGLLLQTGLEYRQVNEKFHLAYETVDVKQVNGVLSVTVDATGNTIAQTTGLKTVTTTKEYLNTTYNHYRFINVPLGAGYRHISRHSRWEISGGVDINLLHRFRGALYGFDLKPVLIGSGSIPNGGIYRRSTGLGLWAAWSCDYPLRGPLRWQWGTRLQMPLRTVTAPDYALKQHYLHFGANLGLVWEFKPRRKKVPVMQGLEPVLTKR